MSHLTHVYGSSDKMRAVNVNDQLVRFSNLRQGDREYTSDFETRYDNQVKANEGVGIVNDDETPVAIDILGKLDPKRFTSLLTVLRNNAAIGISSYPKTLAGAYRAASTWTSDGFRPSRESHSVFVTDKKKTESPDTQNTRDPYLKTPILETPHGTTTPYTHTYTIIKVKKKLANNAEEDSK